MKLSTRLVMFSAVVTVAIILVFSFTGKEILSKEEILVSQHSLKDLQQQEWDKDTKDLKVLQDIEEQKRKEKKERQRLEEEKREQERIAKEKEEQERLAKEAEKRRIAEAEAEAEAKVKEEEQKTVVQKKQENNSKPKASVTEDKKEKVATKPKQNAKGYPGVSAYEREVVRLTNIERVNNGLPELKIDAKLSEVAWYKSKDMVDVGYFDHQSPTYGSPFDMMSQFGVSYTAAGENIAYGYSTPEAVVNGWMNSPGHRANILNEKFTHIGVGHVSQGHYATQMFIKK
ncbi:CAP domain-containing protein [Ornithinibacillus halotolerans]|uniref:SCP domain-containing protein n=1 Tax=Ornithinibacillus halotolerans TaxID=1274357 RepID=A0A916SBN2_9BACI|nr:CAP domain-containing protein [Ornithinibacillus halotolerans]GGA89918.1 hypothetical protein GCM10008025_35630 [Ornithinibacillus halotolerans]